MRNTFKSRITLGSEVLHGIKLAQSEYVARPHYLTTALAIYELVAPEGDPFVVTLNNALLGWRVEYTSQTLDGCLDWLKGSRLPKEAVTNIVEALAENPQAKRGRPAKPRIVYCTRKRRDGSEVTVTVGSAA